MSPKLDIGDALGYGFDRLATRGGAILIGTYVLLQIATQVSFQSLFAEILASALPDGQTSQSYSLALDLPVTVSAGLTTLLLVLSTVLTVVAMRAIDADIDRLPTADHTRRLVRTVGVTIIVSFITFLAILIGTVFFILPGLFLAVSLVFSQLAVVLEDAGVVEALQRSWTLTAGNRLRLFALGIIIAIAGGFAGGAFGLLGVAYPVAGDLVTAVATSVVSLFSIAVLVGAYRQLVTDSGAGSPPESVTTA